MRYSDGTNSSGGDEAFQSFPPDSSGQATPASGNPLRAALAQGTRTDERLSALFRALRDASHELEGVRQANRELVAELHRLHQWIETESANQMALEQRVAQLTLELSDAREASACQREAAADERKRLLEEQDRFVASLLAEQEEADADAVPPSSRGPSEPRAEIERLQRKLSDAEQRISKLVTERNRSRDVARRLQQQRDEAQQALSKLVRRSESGQSPPWTPSTRPSAMQSHRPGRAASVPAREDVDRDHAAPSDAPDAESGGQSALAAALARSHPGNRKPQDPAPSRATRPVFSSPVPPPEQPPSRTAGYSIGPGAVPPDVVRSEDPRRKGRR